MTLWLPPLEKEKQRHLQNYLLNPLFSWESFLCLSLKKTSHIFWQSFCQIKGTGSAFFTSLKVFFMLSTCCAKAWQLHRWFVSPVENLGFHGDVERRWERFVSWFQKLVVRICSSSSSHLSFWRFSHSLHSWKISYISQSAPHKHEKWWMPSGKTLPQPHVSLTI